MQAEFLFLLILRNRRIHFETARECGLSLLQFHKKSFILKLQEHTCSFISYTLYSQYHSNI